MGKVTFQHGEGDDVGGAVTMQIFFVKCLYLDIVNDEDGKLPFRTV